VQDVGVRCDIVYSNPEGAIGHEGFKKVLNPWTNARQWTDGSFKIRRQDRDVIFGGKNCVFF